MLTRYYNRAIEQVWGDVGKGGHNYLLVRYSNDFSIQNLESVRSLKGQEDVFFACHEFAYDEMAEAYEPYLTTIRRMLAKEEITDIDAFLEECDVYTLHRPIIRSYFKTGICRREEEILLEEVANFSFFFLHAELFQLLRNNLL